MHTYHVIDTGLLKLMQLNAVSQGRQIRIQQKITQINEAVRRGLAKEEIEHCKPCFLIVIMRNG
jgi:hypothetical protein